MVPNMVPYWVGAIIVLMIVEAVTVGLTSVWFALGAAAALISALFGAPPWLQVTWFVVVSIAALYFTRPLVQKYVNSRSQPTNADRVLDMTGVVTEAIDNIAGSGEVKIGGKLWTARSASGAEIPKGVLVTAKRIEGVKLMVAPVHEDGEKEE